MRISNHFILYGFAVSCLLFSCSEQDTPVKATTTTPEPAAVEQTNITTAPSLDQGATTTAISDPNPAHGEPGHICEIPVGASLSSAPAPGANAPASAIINSSPAASVPVATDAVTAPGMNPPHGQPGHDCAVAVGSPLPK